MEMYKRERARLEGELFFFSKMKRFFPRCYHARLRYLARLEVYYFKKDYKTVYEELLEKWN